MSATVREFEHSLALPLFGIGMKTQQWPRTGKGQFSFQSQRKAMPKNAQATAQLHTSHMLVNNAQNSPSQASAIHEP